MVMAWETRAGLDLQASWATPAELPFPAATAVDTPLAIMRRTASSTEPLAPPPSDMFATEGPLWWAVTQSMPAMTPLQEPEPLQSSTRTATRRTPLATP